MQMSIVIGVVILAIVSLYRSYPYFIKSGLSKDDIRTISGELSRFRLGGRSATSYLEVGVGDSMITLSTLAGGERNSLFRSLIGHTVEVGFHPDLQGGDVPRFIDRRPMLLYLSHEKKELISFQATSQTIEREAASFVFWICVFAAGVVAYGFLLMNTERG